MDKKNLLVGGMIISVIIIIGLGVVSFLLYDDLQKKINRIGQLESEIGQIKTENTNLKNRVGQLESENQKLSDRIEELRAENKDYKNRMEVCTNQYNELNQECKKLVDEYSNLQRECKKTSSSTDTIKNILDVLKTAVRIGSLLGF